MKQHEKKAARQRANKTNLAQGILLSYRVNRLSPNPVRTVPQTYKVAKKLWSNELKDVQEQVMVLYLDTDNYLIGYRLLNTGTMGACLVDVKLMISMALQLMACGVILIHNHPIDHAQPSPEDVNLTFRVQAALLLVETVLVDHLILSKTGYYSFKEKGNLW